MRAWPLFKGPRAYDDKGISGMIGPKPFFLLLLPCFSPASPSFLPNAFPCPLIFISTLSSLPCPCTPLAISLTLLALPRPILALPWLLPCFFPAFPSLLHCFSLVSPVLLPCFSLGSRLLLPCCFLAAPLHLFCFYLAPLLVSLVSPLPTLLDSIKCH